MRVVSPEDTLAKMLEGNSIARFGDGECKIMDGQREFVYFQDGTDELADELRSIISASQTSSLVGVFNATCQYAPMRRAIGIWHDKLSAHASDRLYYSTLVTRLDVFPRLGTEEFFDSFARLWRGKRVTLISNGVRSLTPEMLIDEGADHVDFIQCPASNAYSQIDELEDTALRASNHVVVMCAGMTATCLAERLARKGCQALDVGHIGRFWRRYADIPVWRIRHDESARGLFNEDGTVAGNPT